MQSIQGFVAVLDGQHVRMPTLRGVLLRIFYHDLDFLSPRPQA